MLSCSSAYPMSSKLPLLRCRLHVELFSRGVALKSEADLPNVVLALRKERH